MEKEFYQWLQTLVFALQLPDWPLEKTISRNEAIVRIANSLNLDPKDPQFLAEASLKLGEILSEKGEELASIPPNLKELVRIYEEHLEEIRASSLKESFTVPTLDEQIKELYQRYREKIQGQIAKPEEELATNPILQEEVSHQIAIGLIKTLPPTAREEGPGSLTEADYRQAIEKIQPAIIQELKLAGVKEPKFEPGKVVTATLPEAKTIAFTPRKTVSVEKLLTSFKLPTLVVEEKIRITPKAAPKLSDLPFLKWQPSGIKISPLRQPWTFSKKAALTPLAKPLQWLIHLAPDDFRGKNLALVYTASGITPRATEQTLEYLYKEKPESSEIPFWQNLRATFKTEKPPFSTLFEHYYEWNYLVKSGVRVESLGTNRLAKIVTFGRFDNFVSLRSSFWQFFKSTRFGGWISRGAGKVLGGLGKFASAFSGVGTALIAGDIFKKAMKIAGAWLLGLLMIAAHYGAAAVTGTLLGGIGGGIAGGIIGYKIGGLIGAAVGGPIGVIIGSIIGFVVGLFAQIIIDKVSAAISSFSLPQAGTAGLSEASTAAVSTAKWFVPTAVATATIGGLIVSQVVSSAFVIPSEEVRLTSPYIEVTKTVEFSGNIGDSINYTIRVKAIDKDLTEVKIVDQPTATCRGTPPFLSEHSWDGNITIPRGEILEKKYSVGTNSQFNDCLISNTARVLAEVEGKTEESFSVGHVIIGNPPEVIPYGLPIRDSPQRGSGYTFGQITEEGIRHEGIDVHGPSGSIVYSTFSSESTVTAVGYGSRGGYYIILSSGKYQIYMGHLKERPKFKVGDKIGTQVPVGIQGDSGHAFGEHVHYQIWENGVIVDPRRFGVPSPPW